MTADQIERELAELRQRIEHLESQSLSRRSLTIEEWQRSMQPGGSVDAVISESTKAI